jgi:hypothetical protein
VPSVLKSGSLSLLEPSGTVQVFNGIALPLRIIDKFYFLESKYLEYITGYLSHYCSNFYAVRNTDISCLWEILVVPVRTHVRGPSIVMIETYRPRYVEHLPIFMVCSGVLVCLQANYDAALSKRLPSRIWTNRARKWTWLPYSRFLSCVIWRWRMWRYERHAVTMNIRIFGKITRALWNAYTSYIPFLRNRQSDWNLTAMISVC